MVHKSNDLDPGAETLVIEVMLLKGKKQKDGGDTSSKERIIDHEKTLFQEQHRECASM